MQYLPLTTNQWYMTYISPFQSQIDANMQSCASPGLYFKVNVDGDISAQARRVFDNLAAVAQAAGGSLAQVVRIGIYVTDLANFAAVEDVEPHLRKPSLVLPSEIHFEPGRIRHHIVTPAGRR